MAFCGGKCWDCKHYYEDMSVGYCECECDNITEEELDKYFTEDEAGCPHYEQEEAGYDTI